MQRIQKKRYKLQWTISTSWTDPSSKRGRVRFIAWCLRHLERVMPFLAQPSTAHPFVLEPPFKTSSCAGSHPWRRGYMNIVLIMYHKRYVALYILVYFQYFMNIKLKCLLTTMVMRWSFGQYGVTNLLLLLPGPLRLAVLVLLRLLSINKNRSDWDKVFTCLKCLWWYISTSYVYCIQWWGSNPWSMRNMESFIHCHYSQVHSDWEWYYLLEPHDNV